MFRGIYPINLDTKYRLAIPTRYRAVLAEQCDGHLIGTVGQVGCLSLYPLPVWEAVEQELVQLPNFVAQTGEVQRMMLAHASELDVDSHGRVLVPTLLRQFANIDKHVVLAGMGKKFELWNADIWAARCAKWQAEGGQSEPHPELARLAI